MACPTDLSSLKIKNNAKYKNGNAAPSLHPDSHCNKCLICDGTCFCANFPLPTTEAAKIGSVGVAQAATTNAPRKESRGTRA